jgi:hypothetical protein
MPQHAKLDAPEGDDVGLQLLLYILNVRDVDLPQVVAVRTAQRIGDLAPWRLTHTRTHTRSS